MIEITHTAADGTVASGTHKDDRSAEILRAANWRWSRQLGACCFPGSRQRRSR